MDIFSIFRSKARQRLFRLYFSNPDSEYYLRELERLLETPVSMIRKELLRLEAEGVFLSKKRGNLTYFHLNKSYPLFDELKSMVFKTVGIQGSVGKILDRLKGVEKAFIYGSYARDGASASSDIDLFILGDVNEDTLVRQLRALEKDLQREINYTLYTKKDLEKKKRQKDAFVSDVLKGPKIMLMGESNDL
ncbi:MAG TPA: nucleotidyltransferase domain-containing protein [Syntrophorhabdales bacterium]|nr:nucleotidyltransferase domain-containing protein [Syntrophorhabdales bacterium]